MSGSDSRVGPVVRVVIPHHLQTLAGAEPEVRVRIRDGAGTVTVRTVLDALEADHPTLRGTIRDHRSGDRRAYLRFFAGSEDWSHEPTDAPLPDRIAEGEEIFRVLGAIAGG